jgi:hypothetical protein
MSGHRIFSTGKDTTYNNYYNDRICNRKARLGVPEKPPISIIQGKTSYRYEGENIQTLCNNDGSMYPYGKYFTPPKTFLPVLPRIDPLVEQSILEYGVNTNFCPTNHLDTLLDHGKIDACLGEIHCASSGNHIHAGGHGLGDHFTVIDEKCHNLQFQQEMEQLKAYRFKCYECINPCCPANMLALQMIRDSRSNKSGTTTTTMTYGSTGTTTTTTTTVKF